MNPIIRQLLLIVLLSVGTAMIVYKLMEYRNQK